MNKTNLLDTLLNLSLPAIMGLVFVVGIFELHMLPFLDSMLNEENQILSNGFLVSQIEYHKEFAPFARRPLTSFLITAASQLFAIKLGNSFVWVNFALLWLCGILLYLVSKRLSKNYWLAIMSLSAFYGTFSIVFAFYPPIFTYDEPLQYVLVFSGMLCLLEQRKILFVLLLSLAIIAKESTIFLLPGFLYLFAKESSGILPKRTAGRIFILGLPILVYLVFLWFFIGQNALVTTFENELGKRTSCFNENFGSPKRIAQTFFSFFLVLGPFLYLVGMNSKTYIKSPWIKAFLVTLCINTPVVLFATLARESRLFALPLLFLWPVFIPLFGHQLALLLKKRTYALYFTTNKRKLSFMGVIVIALLIAIMYYRSGLGHNNLFAPYLFLMLLFIFSHFLVRQPKNQTNQL